MIYRAPLPPFSEATHEWGPPGQSSSAPRGSAFHRVWHRDAWGQEWGREEGRHTSPCYVQVSALVCFHMRSLQNPVALCALVDWSS